MGRLSKCLLEQGFMKKKKFFVKDLNEGSAIVEIQNNSFGKSQHFLNLTINLYPEIANKYQLKDSFLVWAREVVR
jgi:hypothetical protein